MRHVAATRTCFGNVFEGADLQRLFGCRVARIRTTSRWRHRGRRGASRDLDLVADMIAQFRSVARELIGRSVLVRQHVISVRAAQAALNRDVAARVRG